MTKTKLVCTLGPSTEKKEILKKMVKSGLDVARLNFSHGDQKSHGGFIEILQEISELPIIADTKGPKIRTGETERAELKEGSEFILTTEEVLGNEKRISVSYKKLPRKVKRGDKILLNDGKIGLRVKSSGKKEIRCEVKEGGLLKSQGGVNVPGVEIGIKIPTKKDVSDIKFAVKKGVDFIALSQVRDKKDVKKVRKLIGRDNNVNIISKIENSQALKNLDEVIEASDGVMVARGDLGVEIPIIRVPLLQKEIIRKCNLAAKPVIVATQMLHSMVENKKPTRAEVSDVANAVLDRTDAVMLSEETAAGAYPLLALKTMHQIVAKIEKKLTDLPSHLLKTRSRTVSGLIAKNVWQSSRELKIKAIITHTKSGFTARNISKFKPRIPIYAFTSDKKVYRQLNLSWGVESFLAERKETMDEMILSSIKQGLENKLFSKKDLVIVTAGHPLYTTGTTNLMEIQRAGRFLRK